MKKNESKCRVCGNGTLTPHVENVDVTYNDVHGKVESHYLLCSFCGVQAGSKELRQNKRNTIAFRKYALGLLTGAQVREIRNRLGLTQEEAAKCFGGGPVAFSKYENDDVIQSESMDKLLRIAASFPAEVLPVLKKQSKPTAAATPLQAKKQRRINPVSQPIRKRAMIKN